jgi:hypothetical protein
MSARSLALIVVVLSVFVCFAAGAMNTVEFKLVLAPTEKEGTVVDTVKKGPGYVYVHKLPYLADRDIDRVEMFRSANTRGRLLVGFIFNESGKKRLYRLVKKYGTRRIAIFDEGRLIVSSSVLPPEFLGDRVVVRWPGTEDELRHFVLKVSRKPPGLFSLYIEEQGKYNDVAADAWAEAYMNVNKYITAKAKQFKLDRQYVEGLREE